MNKAIYFFIGPQGCGKGTQSKKLSELRGIPHREMSALLIERGKTSDERGKFIEKTMRAGDLVPSPIVIEVLTEAMQSNGWQEVIIDGFPRMIEQAQAATDLIPRGYDVQFVVFELDDEICFARMHNRVKEVEEAQRLRNEQGLPPLEVRTDEDPEKQKRRLSLYRYNYPMVLGHLNETARSRVHLIDASRTVSEIFEDIIQEVPLPAFKG